MISSILFLTDYYAVIASQENMRACISPQEPRVQCGMRQSKPSVKLA